MKKSEFQGQPTFFLFATAGRGQEKEELKVVGNGRIRKREEGIAGFKKGEFRCTRQLGIVTPVAYWRDPYKKRGTFLATQNRGHITTCMFIVCAESFEDLFQELSSRVIE